MLRTYFIIHLMIAAIIATQDRGALAASNSQRIAEWSYTRWDLENTCARKDADISCAVKTLVACEQTHNAIPCAAVGLSQREFEQTHRHDDDGTADGNVIHRPWTMPLSQIMEYGPVFSFGTGIQTVVVREVPPSRFQLNGTRIDSERIASHEVIIETGDEPAANIGHIHSYFFSRDETNGWQIKSMAYWRAEYMEEVNGAYTLKFMTSPQKSEACQDKTNLSPALNNTCDLTVEVDPPALQPQP